MAKAGKGLPESVAVKQLDRIKELAGLNLTSVRMI
jgi:hypothetical protein